MKKQRKNPIVVLLCLFCLATGCARMSALETQSQKVSTQVEKKEISGANSKDEAKTIITWTVPDIIRSELLENNVRRVNDKLNADGYSYELQIEVFADSTYRQDVVSLLETGEADIVSVGINNGDGSTGFAQDFIRQGYLLELSEYLLSEKGCFLKDWYHEDEWKRVEVDGKWYVLPSQNNVYGSFYLAFNKCYVTEDMLKNFQGTPGELKNLLSSMKIPEDVYKILGLNYSMNYLYGVSGVGEERGVFYNLLTGVAENPFKNEVFYQNVKELNDLYHEGLITIFEGSEAWLLERQAVLDGNFVIWVGSKKDKFYEEIKEFVHIVPIQQSMINALGGTSGINAKSDNTEEALQLLTLLYTNEIYTNLLLFGEEGVDYQLLDGYVCDMDGEFMSNYTRSWILGTLDTAYPCSDDFIVVGKNATQDAFFESEYYLPSAILGFQPDCTAFNKDMIKAMMILNNYHQIWKEENLEVAWSKASMEFESSGGNELVAELNRQVEEWMQNTGN